MAQTTRAFVWFIALALMTSACATTSALRAGERAEQLQDYDQAIVEYTRALQKDPDSQVARRSLERAKLRASQDHFTRARRLEATGRLDEALVELQAAAELNPANADIDVALRSVRSQLRNKVTVAREGRTALESLIDRARTLTPSGSELPDVSMGTSVVFRDASSRVVFSAIGQIANITIAFDPQFRDQPVSIDLRNATLVEALQSLTALTRTFYRVSAQRTITIVPDTAAKRREYGEDEVVQVFYLSNLEPKEVVDALRIVIDARRLSPISGTNSISIKDTPERVAAAGRLIAAIDKAKPEVVIDVELLEVDRTRFREYGLQIASPESPGIEGAADVNRSNFTLRDLRNLSQSDIFLTNLPGLYYRLLKQDTATRTLANPQLRTSEGMTAQARFGERVPVPTTQFAPIATGGVNQQPITSFSYENIGVNIDIKPRTHHDDEVTLELKVEVSSVSGAGFGGLPTFGNRSISTVIRLHDGETNLLAGLIRDDERRVLAGVPGLSDIPVVGRLFAHTRKETQETDIVLTLTPHIIRVLDLSEADLRPFRVGREGDAAATGVVDLPAPPQQVPLLPPPDPGQQPRPTPQTPAPAEPGPAGVIAPPPGR